MNRKLNFVTLFLLSLALGAFQLAGAQIAQRQPPPPPPPDPLGMLRHALKGAGAPDLTSQQEDQLISLIKQFREANKPAGPDEALRDAHQAYEAAILAGNSGAANAAAQTIANKVAAVTGARLQAEAGFKIQALAILRSNEQQYHALVQHIGTQGISHILGAMAGGPGPHGPGGPGGPGGPPPAGPPNGPGMQRMGGRGIG